MVIYALVQTYRVIFIQTYAGYQQYFYINIYIRNKPSIENVKPHFEIFYK